MAAIVVAMMLVEVWQNSTVAQVSLQLGRSRSTLQKAQATLAFEQATLARRTTRSELAPVAASLGLVPADARQVVNLPSEYLADAGGADRGGDAAKSESFAERIASALVPDARAKGRAGD